MSLLAAAAHDEDGDEIKRMTAIAEDLQALCDRQALRIAKLESKIAASCQPRTEQEIVDQTEKLAEFFMRMFQQRVKEDPSTTMRGSSDVRAQFCWIVACRVQNMLTDTDPENAAAELENGIGG